MKKFPFALGTSALALALALTGCSVDSSETKSKDSSSSTEAPATSANAADEMFVTMMIPHHQQAIDMADILLEKDDADARVTELAQNVKDAQGPEIERMLSWLEEWGVTYDPDSGMDHGSGDGMMSESDMTALEDASGADASRLFLEQMIMHHEGAVDMARTALQDASNPEVLELAEQVIDDQTSEIGEMNDLIAQL